MRILGEEERIEGFELEYVLWAFKMFESLENSGKAKNIEKK